MERRIDLVEAKARFSGIIEAAMPGGTVVITLGNSAVIRVTAVKPANRAPGTGKGVRMAPDFDAPLPDFAEQM